MGTIVEITTSLDGFVAGPNPSLEHPVAEGGERLHEWVVALEAFRERHGMEGGEAKADSERIRESVDATGAVVIWDGACSAAGKVPGRRIPTPTAGGATTRPSAPRSFIVTSHPRETVAKQGGTSYTFVTDGVESAVRQAREAAGAKDVGVAGGANVVQQALGAGLVDEFRLHLAPVMLGSGTRLFEGLGDVELERTAVIDSPAVTHLTFRIVK